MGRQTDRERTQQIAGYVEQHPGVRPAEIAKALNVPRSSVTRTLPALEDAGRLLYEDDRGGCGRSGNEFGGEFTICCRMPHAGVIECGQIRHSYC